MVAWWQHTFPVEATQRRVGHKLYPIRTRRRPAGVLSRSLGSGAHSLPLVFLPMYKINETHDPNLKSWVESANDPETDFPIQNLPFCRFGRVPVQIHGNPRWGSDFGIGVAIGDQILDLEVCDQWGLLNGMTLDMSGIVGHRGAQLTNLMNTGEKIQKQLFSRIRTILGEGAEKSVREAAGRALFPLNEAYFDLSHFMANYTDFYCSIYHATNVGSMFRPDNPLLPNYKYVPIGYHGRASSIVISWTDIKRPHGQNRSDA